MRVAFAWACVDLSARARAFALADAASNRTRKNHYCKSRDLYACMSGGEIAIIALELYPGYPS